MSETAEHKDGQNTEIAELEQRIADLESQLETTESPDSPDSEEASFSASRRSVLGGILGTGLLFGASGTASAATNSGTTSANVATSAQTVHDVDILRADKAYIDSPKAAPTGISNVQKEIYNRPSFGLKDKTLAVDTSNLSYTSDPQYWPTIFHAGEVLDNPLGEFYMYWSGNHGSDSAIGMAYADDPTGSWTLYSNNPVIDFTSGQDETPSAVWNDDTGELYLYFHTFAGTVQSTELATSTDGISFSREGVVLDTQDGGNQPGNGHTGYFSPHKFGSQWFGYHLWGGGGTGRFGISYSNDGKDWHIDPRPLGLATDVVNNNDLRVEYSRSNVLNINGTLWWIGLEYAANCYGGGGCSGDYRDVSLIAPMLNPRQMARQPEPIGELTESWESALFVNDTFTYEGDLYVLYESGDSNFAVARLGGAL